MRKKRRQARREREKTGKQKDSRAKEGRLQRCRWVSRALGRVLVLSILALRTLDSIISANTKINTLG
jgi:hypothetical protein